MVAKALGRQGNAHRRLGELDKAKVAFEKALTEHRTPDNKAALSEVEKLIKQRAEEEYVNPELAEEEKQKGNEFFKKGDYGSAVKHYSEAIRSVTGEISSNHLQTCRYIIWILCQFK